MYFFLLRLIDGLLLLFRIVKLQNNTIGNKVFEDWFNYIPHVPEEKVHPFYLINLLNCTYSK